MLYGFRFILKMSNRYFYIKSPEDHYDLEDLFEGIFIHEKQMWKIDKSKEKDVMNFLYCSDEENEENIDTPNEMHNENDERTTTSQLEIDSENNESDSASESEDDIVPVIKISKRDRLHRANSFNASDSSNEDCESIESDYRRKRAFK